MTGFQVKRTNNKVCQVSNFTIMRHWSSKGYARRTESEKKNIWSRSVRNRSSTRFGPTTSRLCTNYAARDSLEVYFTTQKTGSTWWKRYRKENSKKCEKFFPTTTSTWRVIQIAWLFDSMVCTRFSGVTETKRCKWDSWQSWVISSRTILWESGMTSKDPHRAEPFWKATKTLVIAKTSKRLWKTTTS